VIVVEYMCDIPVNLLQPFIDTQHMVLVSAGKDSYFIALFVFSQANVASNQFL